MIISKELQTQWVAALRSGEYKQGETQMRMLTDEGELAYCCLGVLCELDERVKWDEELGGYVLKDEIGPFTKSNNAIPPHAGFDQKLNMLASLNDEGLTFDQIADVIENGHLSFHPILGHDEFGIVELPDWSKE